MVNQFEQHFQCIDKKEVISYKKGDTVINEGDSSDYFLFLAEGELSVYNFMEDGKEFLQHRIVAGNFFGEPAVLLRKSFPANVEVSSESATIYRVRYDHFLMALRTMPDFHLEFTQSIAEKAIKKSRSLKNIIFQSAEERILNYLNDYKQERGEMGKKILIEFTRKELSNMTGLRIETIIRTVKKMEKEGILEIKNGKIFI